MLSGMMSPTDCFTIERMALLAHSVGEVIPAGMTVLLRWLEHSVLTRGCM